MHCFLKEKKNLDIGVAKVVSDFKNIKIERSFFFVIQSISNLCCKIKFCIRYLTYKP